MRPPHYYGHRERLRFRDAGAEAVSDHELLELVPFGASLQRDVKPLAKKLIAKFGSLSEVVAPAVRLAEVKGVGDAAITGLKVVHAAASRLSTRVGAEAPGAVVVVERSRLLPCGAGLRR